ncbi:MAG: ATP-binding protein [Proteobacteria bacterium]|nr:ATP-binding protein [Pseudomonadota bacterium]
MFPIPDPIKRLVDGNLDAAVVVDSEWRILYYNHAYHILSGLRGRQLGQKIEAGVRPCAIFRFESCGDNCPGCDGSGMRSGQCEVEVQATRRSDGQEMTFILATMPLDSGIAVITYRDVTAEVGIQERLERLLDRERRQKELLEEKARESTEELRQAQVALVHRAKMSTLGLLVAGIAHELNKPINFVYSNAEYLGDHLENLLSLTRAIDTLELSEELRSELDAVKEDIDYDYVFEDSRKLIHSVRAGAERTASIAQDLRTFSGPSGGRLRVADIKASIETTLSLIAPLLKNRVEVRRHISPNLPKLVCNTGHINQVFMNILTNAAQAIEGNGFIDVTIDTINGGNDVRVSVVDSGQGIPADIIEKITDPFFTTKVVGEGTGLGLWITENIVRAHGGTMRCESEVGKGTLFTVILPVKSPETATNTLIEQPRAA